MTLAKLFLLRPILIIFSFLSFDPRGFPAKILHAILEFSCIFRCLRHFIKQLRSFSHERRTARRLINLEGVRHCPIEDELSWHLSGQTDEVL